MSFRFILATSLLFFRGYTHAQQFIGNDNTASSNISKIPENPAWTATANSGMEINFLSANFLLGTNAYRFDKKYVGKGFADKAIEGKDYFKDLRSANKHVWGNIDAIGPAVAFSIDKESSFAIYTRMREITRGGNLSKNAFQFIGNNDNIPKKQLVDFSGAGFTMHNFSELGFSYGRLLKDDLYHIFRGGITVKFLLGIAAGSIYTSNAQIIKNTPDTTNKLNGDVKVEYSNNIKPYVDWNIGNDINAWFNRNGKWSFGLDLGMQYEYHPNGDPNKESPYLYSIALSITDIGAIKYKADTGSAEYHLQINRAVNRERYKLLSDEAYLNYFYRMQKDSLIKLSKQIKDFKAGLPTALRLNTDWNFDNHFFIQLGLLLNLKGSHGDVYNPGYVNMLSFTSRYEYKTLSIGIPITFIGYQTITAGAVIHAGPLFVGSSSVLSTVFSQQIRTLDGYAGISLKFKNRKNNYSN